MKINSELIEKFLKDQCTDTEAEIVLKYLKEYPDELEVYLPLQNLMDDSESVIDATVSAGMLKHIRKHYNQKPILKWKSILRYAAAASIVGLMTLAANMLFKETGRSMPVQANMNKRVDSSEILKTVQNNTAKIINALLPDSSTVNIYPNSRIQYLPTFEKSRRLVSLKGKAKFSITKNALRPFAVYTSGIAVTVLGTSFIVSEMNSQKTSVKLIEGSIKVDSRNTDIGSKSIMLQPGDELVVNNNEFDKYHLEHERTEENKGQGQHATKLIIQKENRLSFKNQQLKEVFISVEEKFDVVIKDETDLGLEKKLFTGTFLEEDNLEFIIKMICNLYGLQYKIEHNTVFIIK